MRRFIRAFVLSAALGLAGVASAVAEPMQLVVNGQTRSFVLERPPAAGPRPTIVVLHGAGSSGAREAQADFGRLAPQAGFVAVFPEGRGARWNHLPPGTESAEFARLFHPHGRAPDDVAFLKALVADLVRRGISDPKRVYLAGTSAGGIMTLRMVCLGEPTFAAIALMVASMPEVTGASCRLPRPLPVLMINGTADDVVPFGGGPVKGPPGFPSFYSVWAAERLVALFRQLFRQHNGCAEPAEKSVLPGQSLYRVEVERSAKCSGGGVEYYRVIGGSHAARVEIANASRLVLEFFRDRAAPAVAAAPGQPAVADTSAARPSGLSPSPPPVSGADYEDSYEQAFANSLRAQLSYPAGASSPPAASPPNPRPTLSSDYEVSFEQALADFRKRQPSVAGAAASPHVVTPAPAPKPTANAPRPASPPVAAPVPKAPGVAALPPATAKSAPARVALVIGNGNYRHATRLANPANDASDIAQVLRRLGFDVIEGRDLDKRGMEDKVREFGRKLDRAELALFFYAGHGMSVAGKNYLVPVDAKLERPGDLNLDTVDVSFILAQMEAEQRVNLVFLDACRDNPLARSFARSLGARSTSVGQGLTTIQSAVGTLIAFATQPEAVALDGEGRNSPFTTALLKHLSTPGLEIALLMRRVRADVIAATRSQQVPWDHSSLIGEVFLAR